MADMSLVHCEVRDARTGDVFHESYREFEGSGVLVAATPEPGDWVIIAAYRYLVQYREFREGGPVTLFLDVENREAVT